MTTQQALNQFRHFDIANASVALWVFKKRPLPGGGNAFSANWVMTSGELRAELASIAIPWQTIFTEAEDYSLLAQPNENGLLGLLAAGTRFADLRALVDRPEEEHQVDNQKKLNNAAGYVVKFSSNGQKLYCVKKTTSSWKTKKSSSVLNLVFRQQELDIVQDPAFSLDRSFDFFVIGDRLLVATKAAFESLLDYKTTYSNSFLSLQQEPAFVQIFEDMNPLITHVGTNSIQLRRMAVIKQKGFYKDPNYLARLRQINGQKGWGILFDANGRIQPTEATLKVILQVFLDHRLHSELSLATYDVPSTVPV